ncbi:60S ribosomal export protein NMD3-like protein [Drosera capensis]
MENNNINDKKNTSSSSSSSFSSFRRLKKKKKARVPKLRSQLLIRKRSKSVPCTPMLGYGSTKGYVCAATHDGNVLCCECGTSIPPNAANMCAKCFSSRVNITEGLQKRVTVVFCPECRRYLQPLKTWIRAEWESEELLTFCVKRLKLKDVRLVGAEFKFSVENSKRIIVKLTIQREVLHGAILEKSYEVVYVVLYYMCDSCKRIQANPDQQVASVQLRQKTDHSRTFFYLEQLILKHNAHPKP